MKITIRQDNILALELYDYMAQAFLENLKKDGQLVKANKHPKKANKHPNSTSDVVYKMAEARVVGLKEQGMRICLWDRNTTIAVTY